MTMNQPNGLDTMDEGDEPSDDEVEKEGKEAVWLYKLLNHL